MGAPLKIMIDGREWRIAELAREAGCTPMGMWQRVKRGETGESLLRPVNFGVRKPMHGVASIMFDGKQMSINQIWHAYGRALGLSYHTLRARVLAGDTGDRLLRPPQVAAERLARYGLEA